MLILVLVILLILFTLALLPAHVDEERVKGLVRRNYAHRGLHSKNQETPENSLKAFSLAAQNGYGMELDVQLTSDNKVVVFHDDDLKRMCGIDKPVISYDYDTLSKISLAGTDEHIPLFTDMLHIVDGRTPLIVELKKVKDYKLLCRLTYEILKEYKGKYCIESFDPRIVFWFRMNAPEIIRGQLSDNQMKNKSLPWIVRLAVTNLLTNFISHPHFIAYGYSNMSNFFYKIVTGPLRAISVAWTVRDEKTYEELIAKGIQIIIFEDFTPDARFK